MLVAFSVPSNSCGLRRYDSLSWDGILDSRQFLKCNCEGDFWLTVNFFSCSSYDKDFLSIHCYNFTFLEN